MAHLPPRSVPLTVDLRKQMPDLEQVLKEVLPVISPVSGGFRSILQDCEFNGDRLAQGWQSPVLASDQRHLC